MKHRTTRWATQASACAAACLIAFGALLPAAAIAATFRVDDSTSIPNETNVTMRWKSANPNRLTGNAVEAAILITMRLNVAPWLNKTGKIYMRSRSSPSAWSTSNGQPRDGSFRGSSSPASARSSMPVRYDRARSRIHSQSE